MKIIDAKTKDGESVSFWLKLGWSKVPYAAIQFGMFSGPDGSRKTNAEFMRFVRNLVGRVKTKGVTHALLVHRDALAIALRIDDVAQAYDEQMRRFPSSARNTKSPTMWFYDPRPDAKTELTAIVRQRAIPLDVLARYASIRPDEPEALSGMAQVETRILQVVFRNRVGERFGWRCAVSGCDIREVLDAAHLPGKDWRRHNEASDGIMLRVDIHRLFDAGLASIVDGIFHIDAAARAQYGQYDGVRLST